jgi:hypothetical protein
MGDEYHFYRQHPAMRAWEGRFVDRLASMDVLFGKLKLLAVDRIEDKDLAKVYGDILVWYRSLVDSRVDYMVAGLKCDLWELRNRETGNLAIEVGTVLPDGTFEPRNMDVMVWHWRGVDDTVYVYIPSRLDLEGKKTTEVVNRNLSTGESYSSRSALYPVAELSAPKLVGFFGAGREAEIERLMNDTKEWW